MNLTQQQLDLLRSHPHRTNLWLSIYRPNTFVAAIVTGTYELGDRQISYTLSPSTPQGFSYLDLYPDMTVLVGTEEGLSDVGTIRLRSATGTYVVVAENAINWQHGQYLTMVDYITVEAIYPRIIQDPNDDENVIFYKDYDIPYSNQNTVYGTFPNAGPHRAGFREFNATGTTAQFYYTATGTYNVAGSALTYSWAFGGGSPASSSALTPGLVTYATPGHYKTRLRVTAANGAIDDTYRYVSVYDRPEAGTNVPILKWEFQGLSGSRSEGGYTASFKVFENIGDVIPNALVVIFADNWYGSTKQSIGGNAQGNSSIVFVGYILSDTIRFDYKESSVEFQVGSISEVMKNAEGFSVSCESKASPATWFELQEMTVPKAMYHYLRWHSTVLKVTDFQYTGDDRLVQYFDSDRGSLYDAVDSFMRDGMLGSVISDRQGKLWAEISSFGYQAPFSSVPTRFTFHKQDWIGSPTIQERRNSDLSFIELGGIAFYGVDTNTFSALLTAAPSTVPLYHGKSDRNDGLILTSQEALNQTAGHYLAHFNTKFPDISLSMAGNYSNLDIAPQEKTYLVIDQNDSVRGKSIQDLPYIVDGLEWSYDPREESFRPDATLLQIATGTAGQTVLIPAVPPDGGYGYPEIDLPPLPDFGGTPGVGPTVPMTVLFHDEGGGMIVAYSFDGTPRYETINGGLTAAQYQRINWLGLCPNGALYVAYIAEAGSGAFIARAPSIGSMFEVLYEHTNSDSNDSNALWSIGINPLVAEQIAFVRGPINTANQKLYSGSYGAFTAGAAVPSGYSTSNWGLSFGDNRWLLTYFNKKAIFSADGSSLIDFGATNPPYEIGVPHIRPSALSGITYHKQNPTGHFLMGTDNLTTLVKNSETSAPFQDTDTTALTIACDPSGQYLMSGSGGKIKSSDFGASWASLSSLPVGTWCFGYAGAGTSGQRFIAAGAVVRFTPDFGSTWINKENSSLTDIVPFPEINLVKVVG